MDTHGKILCCVSLGERNVAESVREVQRENAALREAVDSLRAELRATQR